MAAIDFHNLSDSDKRIIFTASSEREGLPAYAVEKDWWVVQTLRIIFKMEVSENRDLFINCVNDYLIKINIIEYEKERI